MRPLNFALRSTASLAALILLLSCRSSTHPAADAQPGGADWSGQMQNMAQAVKTLVPYLYNAKAYSNPKNRESIHARLAQFSQAAHKVPEASGKEHLGDVLLVKYSLANLKADLNRALRSFDEGQYEYSRSVAKASLTHCFRCHSVTRVGSSARWDLSQLQNLNLAPLEKADLLVATRKYDEALNYMERLLGSKAFLNHDPFDFESMLRRYMALIIRAKNNPRRALAELNKILAGEDVPHYLEEQTEGWRKSLKSWMKERRQPIRSTSALFAQVRERFKHAAKIQNYEKDHAGDVEYLRATALLHEGMRLVKTPEERAQALYLLGRAYEVLDELGSWNLHETYYEACILIAAHAPIAQPCYDRLEASLYMGYSGSSGTHLPPEERERLIRLKKEISSPSPNTSH